MTRILLLAATTGYQTRSLADAARRIDVDVTLATDRCHVLEDPWQDRAVAVRFDKPEESALALVSEARGIGIEAIAAAGDRPTYLASLTAEKLGIAWHPPAAALACRDKHKMRELFERAGLPAPANTSVPVESENPAVPEAIGFPCVLKPLGLSASRGVIRANAPAEFVAAFHRIRGILQDPDILRLHEESRHAIQIEQYIPGREFALEGLMTEGKLHVLAIFDKPDPLEGPFFEESIYVTPSRESPAVQSSIIATAAKAAHALGLWHGPIHAEMRVNAQGVYMLEIAARPIGGLCARSLRFWNLRGQPITLEHLIVLHAIGRMPARIQPASPASGVMMIPVPSAGVFGSIEGLEEARGTDGVDDVVITIKPGEKLRPLPEGAGYPGFIFSSGPDPRSVENALRIAHRKLTFRLLAALPVIP